MGWYDRECPTDSRDAYYEGRRAREYESNPYEHGRDDWSGKCREAYDEWQRGARYAEYDREQQREEEAAERRRQERRAEEARQEEAYYAEQYAYAMDQQYPEPKYPEPEYPAPEESSPPAHTEGQS